MKPVVRPRALSRFAYITECVLRYVRVIPSTSWTLSKMGGYPEWVIKASLDSLVARGVIVPVPQSGRRKPIFMAVAEKRRQQQT